MGVPPFRMREAGIKILALTAEARELQGGRPEVRYREYTANVQNGKSQ
jgi:hypothetical protein